MKPPWVNLVVAWKNLSTLTYAEACIASQVFREINYFPWNSPFYAIKDAILAIDSASEWTFDEDISAFLNSLEL